MARVWGGDLPPVQLLTLMALADHADDFGQCWPSLKRIAWKVGYSEQSVRRAIKQMQDDAIITITKRPGYTSLYVINVDQITLKPYPLQNDTPTIAVSGGVLPQPCQGGTDIAMIPEPSVKHQKEPSTVAPLAQPVSDAPEPTQDQEPPARCEHCTGLYQATDMVYLKGTLQNAGHLIDRQVDAFYCQPCHAYLVQFLVASTSTEPPKYNPDAPGFELTSITREQWERLTPKEQEIWPYVDDDEPTSAIEADYTIHKIRIVDNIMYCGCGQAAISKNEYGNYTCDSCGILYETDMTMADLCPAWLKTDQSKPPIQMWCEACSGINHCPDSPDYDPATENPTQQQLAYREQLLQNRQSLGAEIDHSPLTPDEIVTGLEVAKEYGLAEPQLPIGDSSDDNLVDDSFEDKNVNGSVPIFDNLCPNCSKFKNAMNFVRGESSLCECEPDGSRTEAGQDNPFPEFAGEQKPLSPEAIAWGMSVVNDLELDNPNLSQLSQEQAWIMHTLARDDVDYLHHSTFAGALGIMMVNMRAQKYLNQAGANVNGYRLANKGKQWVTDNPDAIQKQVTNLIIEIKGKKAKKSKRKFERKLESLSPEVIPIAEALANCRHGSTYNDVLNGRREGIRKIAIKMHDDGLTGDDVETIQAYFEHRAKEQPDGANVWLKCNYDTYYKHAQDALDWKKSAPGKSGNDGIRLARIAGDTDD